MAQNFDLQHIDQYLCLPELEIPVVSADDSLGRVYSVLTVDLYIALISDCREREVEAMEIPGIYRCALPAVVIEEKGGPECFRLPHSLAEWIYELMRDREYESHFPATIEFSILRDEHYAKFIESSVR